MEDGEYMNVVAGYTSSILQNFETYLRAVVGLVEDDFRLVLEEYNSSFISYELQPGLYTFKDLCEVLSRKLQLEFDGVENATDIEFDDYNMKNKLLIRPSFIAIRFDEKSFFSCI